MLYATYKDRVHNPHIPVITDVDIGTLVAFGILSSLSIYIYIFSGSKEERTKIYALSAINTFAVVIPQVIAAQQVYLHGRNGISGYGLCWASAAIVSRILYYVYVQNNATNPLKKMKARSIVIGESGNWISWSLICLAFYFA